MLNGFKLNPDTTLIFHFVLHKTLTWWYLVVLVYNVIDVGHIHGEDDNSRQVWVPKKYIQRIKS